MAQLSTLSAFMSWDAVNNAFQADVATVRDKPTQATVCPWMLYRSQARGCDCPNAARMIGAVCAGQLAVLKRCPVREFLDAELPSSDPGSTQLLR